MGDQRVVLLYLFPLISIEEKNLIDSSSPEMDRVKAKSLGPGLAGLKDA